MKKRILSALLIMAMLFGTFTFVPKTVKAAEEDYIFLDAGDSYEVQSESSEVTFEIVPAETGFYRFYSTSALMGSIDAYLEGPNTWEYGIRVDGDFTLTYLLKEGETYYLTCDNRSGSKYQVYMETVSVETLTSNKTYSAHEEYDLWLEIKPQESGYYKIFTSNNTNGDSLRCTLMEGMELYTRRDKEGEDVTLGLYLSKDSVYYLQVTGDAYSSDIQFEKVKEVTEIEIVSHNAKLIEGIDGYWEEDKGGNKYFVYTYDISQFDIVLNIFYEDGTNEIVPYDFWIDGFAVDENNPQWEGQRWTVGADQYITLTYRGCDVNIPIEIVANPVQRISFQKVPNCKGTLIHSWYDYVALTALKNMELPIEYTDGTSRVVTEDDLDEYGCLDGQYVDCYIAVDVEEPGTYTAILEYMKQEVTFEVEVDEFPYKSIEVIKGPDHATVYLPDFIGMQLKLNRVDGTEEILTITEKNIGYQAGQIYYGYVELTDLGLYLFISQDFEYGLEGDFYRVDIAEVVYCNYYDMQYLDKKPIRSIAASNVSLDIDGMKFAVTYEDGTVQNLNVEKAYEYYSDKENEVSWLIRTELGMSDCDVIGIDKDSDGVIDEYEIHVFEQTILVPAEVDGDEDNIVCAHSNAKFIEEKMATCTEDGHIAYWICEECGKVYADEAYTEEITMEDIVIEPIPHATIYFEAVEPGCHYLGNVEYWFCSICEGFWTDAECTKLTNSKSVILPETKEGELVHVEAKDATCKEEGNIEHWYCKECEQFWQDEALTQLTNSHNVIIGKTDDHKAVAIPKVPAQVGKNGLTEGSKCSVCGTILKEQEKTPALKLTAPKASKVTKATGGKKKITVKFKKVSGVTGYEIQIATKKNMKKGLKTYKVTKSKDMKNAKYVVKKLKSKTTYYVRICTYKVVNGEKIASKWSAKKAVKTK